MRNALIVAVLALFAILWLGRSPRDPFQGSRPPQPGRVAKPLDVDCRYTGANALACAQKYCEEGLIQRGLLPPRVPVDWHSFPVERAQDRLVITVFGGRFTAAGEPRYVECQMVGKAIMSAREVPREQVPLSYR